MFFPATSYCSSLYYLYNIFIIYIGSYSAFCLDNSLVFIKVCFIKEKEEEGISYFLTRGCYNMYLLRQPPVIFYIPLHIDCFIELEYYSYNCTIKYAENGI